VTNAQSNIRSKKSLKKAESIAPFTCVTTFLLPTRLPTSSFSLNGIPDPTVIGCMVVTAAVALLITTCVLSCLLGQYVGTWVQGIRSYLRDGQSSHAVSTENKDDMHTRMNCEEGEAREGDRPSSLLRDMGPFRRATTYLEFRTVENVEGRMKTHSSLTKNI
jgi:hypothetical protein